MRIHTLARAHTHDARNAQERSPIFLQFLDGVYQLLAQFPTRFEYNESLLRSIALHACSGELRARVCVRVGAFCGGPLNSRMRAGWFGTFMLNSVRERELCELSTTAVSFWSYVTANRPAWLNPLYERPPTRALGDSNGITELVRRGRPGGSVLVVGSGTQPTGGAGAHTRRWCPGLVLRPSHAQRGMRLWTELYLAWDDEVLAYTRGVSASLALARGVAAAEEAAYMAPASRRSSAGRPGGGGALDSTEQCAACGKRLGWMHRRRECSACHLSFCRRDCQHRRVVDGVAAKDGGLLVRVCKACSIASDRGTLAREVGAVGAFAGQRE